ncbi:MAG: molybdopterin converting factor subunit 1 [Chloroflexi bacterium RBG_19FT_COMBO_55_16]|nr:MAG: molybdopterin converting factor subunit 1 [Chloroflexi bacterium RBG_19FT_COMBO_55_16]
MNKVNVLFFASLRERAGLKQTTLELQQGASVKDLKGALKEKYPSLTPALEASLVSVNREYAFDEDTIPEGAEVALFPPVSGGARAVQFPTIFAITDDELDLDSLVARITLSSTGAVCLFTGVVRGFTARDNPHQTEYLEYEAYRPMAETKMRQVADEIRQHWPSVEGIAIVQRIGHLNPGTPTVLIACSAAHRDTGIFEAARYGIDRLKEIVPIWKKEVGPQGEVWVEGEHTPHREG